MVLHIYLTPLQGITHSGEKKKTKKKQAHQDFYENLQIKDF